MLCIVVYYCVFLCIVVYCFVLLCIVVFCCALLCIVVYCCILLSIVVYCCVLLCIIVYCCVLLCIVVYCFVLLCIVVYCNPTEPTKSYKRNLSCHTLQNLRIRSRNWPILKNKRIFRAKKTSWAETLHSNRHRWETWRLSLQRDSYS